MELIQRLGKTGGEHRHAVSGDRECHEEEQNRGRWEGAVLHRGWEPSDHTSTGLQRGPDGQG